MKRIYNFGIYCFLKKLGRIPIIRAASYIFINSVTNIHNNFTDHCWHILEITALVDETKTIQSQSLICLSTKQAINYIPNINHVSSIHIYKMWRKYMKV